MTYKLFIPEHLDTVFQRLSVKNHKQLEIINKKIQQILENPFHFKPLRGDMHGARRVHIDSSFVLTFEIDDETGTIKLLDYEHHDNIY